MIQLENLKKLEDYKAKSAHTLEAYLPCNMLKPFICVQHAVVKEVTMPEHLVGLAIGKV